MDSQENDKVAAEKFYSPCIVNTDKVHFNFSSEPAMVEPSTPDSDITMNNPGSPFSYSVPCLTDEKQEMDFNTAVVSSDCLEKPQDKKEEKESEHDDDISDLLDFSAQQEWLFWMDIIFPRPFRHRGNMLWSQTDAHRLIDAFHVAPSRIPTQDYHPCLLWAKKCEKFRLGQEHRRKPIRRLIYDYCHPLRDRQGEKIGTVKQNCPANHICIQPYHLCATIIRQEKETLSKIKRESRLKRCPNNHTLVRPRQQQVEDREKKEKS